MAAPVTLADLVLVPCDCRPTDRLPDGTAPTWWPVPRAAARAVQRHVEAGDLYWAVHLDGAGDAHVVSARVAGAWWGPHAPGR